jgi:hypothetical protein
MHVGLPHPVLMTSEEGIVEQSGYIPTKRGVIILQGLSIYLRAVKAYAEPAQQVEESHVASERSDQ